MDEVVAEEAVEDEDAAQGHSAADDNVEPEYDDEFEDNPDELEAALKVASSSLGAAAALATATARDAEQHLATAAALQEPARKLQQHQQQQEQLHVHGHVHSATLQKQSGTCQAGGSSQQQMAQLLTQVSHSYCTLNTRDVGVACCCSWAGMQSTNLRFAVNKLAFCNNLHVCKPSAVSWKQFCGRLYTC